VHECKGRQSLSKAERVLAKKASWSRREASKTVEQGELRVSNWRPNDREKITNSEEGTDLLSNQKDGNRKGNPEPIQTGCPRG